MMYTARRAWGIIFFAGVIAGVGASFAIRSVLMLLS